MSQIAPEGPVYQAGTLSGNPLAMAAGLATLELLAKPGAYEQLGAVSARMAGGLEQIARELGVPLCASAAGGIFGFFFCDGPVRNFDDAARTHPTRFKRFFSSMLEQGVYLAPSAYECGFASLAHRPRDLDRTLEAARVALEKAARAR
jgi:glutamate-1-semialdehyde 2,1-aminomutase